MVLAAVDDLGTTVLASPRSTPLSSVRSPLAAALAEEMAERWRRGERPQVEDYLAQHPELADQPDAVLQLLNEELCLCQEHGRTVDHQALLARFPQYQAQLQILLQCHEMLEPAAAPPQMPEVGEVLGDFYLAAELGRGALGRVFLATQPALADRPLVLKVAPRDGHEHLSLARLQHTHIVPLYSVHEDTARNLRVICMPYFGGVNLDTILLSLSSKPFAQRTGQDILVALDRFRRDDFVPLQPRGPARRFLARCSYVEAVCWIGACLADALHYAHERDLLHLDIKPTNVLLTDDAQPMLLDFHLARPPVRSAGPYPEWFGGTRGYMSPEQEVVLRSVRENRTVPCDVDQRSDIFGLGLVLYRMLGGVIPEIAQECLPRLDCCNRAVSTGLDDLIARCLCLEPSGRYHSAAELAADLRRHMAHQPLRGVSNRSWGERWRKWRRRRPHALGWGLLLCLSIATLGLAGSMFWRQIQEDTVRAQAALIQGEEQLQRRHYEEAVHTFAHALTRVENRPGSRAVAASLQTALTRAQHNRAAQTLHDVAERMRFLADESAQSTAGLRQLEQSCRALWEARTKIQDAAGRSLSPEMREQAQVDLLDVAVLWSDLRVRLADPAEIDDARLEALRVLAEAETLFGPSSVLHQERRGHAEALGLHAQAELAAQSAALVEPRSTWEFFAEGRTLMRKGAIHEARRRLDGAVSKAPGSFWANFYQGQCAYRAGQHADAIAAFRTCLSLEPDRAECYYNRGLAYAALKDVRGALRDYDRALELNPRLAAASLNRGILRLQAGHVSRAREDFQAALANGADPALVKHNLALLDRRASKR
jgi:tetratricopeptide (TPR) repeat protein